MVQTGYRCEGCGDWYASKKAALECEKMDKLSRRTMEVRISGPSGLGKGAVAQALTDAVLKIDADWIVNRRDTMTGNIVLTLVKSTKLKDSG